MISWSIPELTRAKSDANVEARMTSGCFLGDLLLTGDERAVRAEKIADQALQKQENAELIAQQAEALLQKYRDRFGDIV